MICRKVTGGVCSDWGVTAYANMMAGINYTLMAISAMIDHHDDAVHIFERILRYTEREDLRSLAQQIIDDQRAEIKSMEVLLVEIVSSN